MSATVHLPPDLPSLVLCDDPACLDCTARLLAHIAEFRAGAVLAADPSLRAHNSVESFASLVLTYALTYQSVRAKVGLPAVRDNITEMWPEAITLKSLVDRHPHLHEKD